jgi:thioredoxin reductase (NADPH)
MDADVVIVGGGPAGLAAALVLARALRSVVVLDTGSGRSTWPQVNHNLLGFPGGVEARRLRELGHEQLREYDDVRVVSAEATGAAVTDGGFRVRGQSGDWTGRALLLATGVVDHYPHFPGWETYVGRSLHWCLACDGYESRGRRLVAIGADTTAALDALALRRFSDDVTLITNSQHDDLDPEHLSRLDRAGVRVLYDRVVRAEGEDGQLAALLTAGGSRVDCDVAFSLQGSTPRNALALELGVPVNEGGFVEIDCDQRTPVAGVFAAGDVTRVHSHQVSAALHEGAQAGHAIAWTLLPPELQS